MASNSSSVKLDLPSKIVGKLVKIKEPVVGLQFVKEVRKYYDNYLKLSYMCELCKENCCCAVMIEHILTTKHRLAYFKAVDPGQYAALLQSMKSDHFELFVEKAARLYEISQGCGEIEVKLEVPKMVITDSVCHVGEICENRKCIISSPPREDPVYEGRAQKMRSFSHRSPRNHHYASRRSKWPKAYHSFSHRHSKASSEKSLQDSSASLPSNFETWKLSTSEKIKLIKILACDILPIPRADVCVKISNSFYEICMRAFHATT